MKKEYSEIRLTHRKDGRWWFQAHPQDSPTCVFSVQEATQYLHKSRRQIYRYIQPEFLAPLFPEYDLSDLNAGRFRNLIINRILEWGSLKQVKWLMRRYLKKDVRRAIREDGQRFLSNRALTFWSFYFKEALSPSWRTRKKNPWQH
ncbi:MAG: hypothetical protein HYY62_04170 [Deltaproteobacteria bacterium]|nr:hypothetical protein [Deltaproteobacteria bacterium]